MIDDPGFGAFVISLDVELHWGVRDHMTVIGTYLQNLLGERVVVPRLLDLFQRYGIAGTWAIVGFLFAASQNDLDKVRPRIRPAYTNPALDPYAEPIGNGEQDDPLHYAASIVEQIRQSANQEIATHTLSHYYCLEPGQTKETFQEDLRCALAIAAQRGIKLHSIVFPRNQVNPAYVPTLVKNGIFCYRGRELGQLNAHIPRGRKTAALRLRRLADTYFNFSGSQVVRWSEILQSNGSCNVRGSRFLGPYRPSLKLFEGLRLGRISSDMELAAKNHSIFHLWTHPHNLGVNIDTNLHFFDQILQCFAHCEKRYGMRSLSMLSVAKLARSEGSCSHK